jgi:hypothetical protein
MDTAATPNLHQSRPISNKKPSCGKRHDYLKCEVCGPLRVLFLQEMQKQLGTDVERCERLAYDSNWSTLGIDTYFFRRILAAVAPNWKSHWEESMGRPMATTPEKMWHGRCVHFFRDPSNPSKGEPSKWGIHTEHPLSPKNEARTRAFWSEAIALRETAGLL